MAATRPGSSLQDPGVASLLAALAGGEAAQVTLHASGLAPLSTVYATVWGQGNKDTTVERWKLQLAGGGGDGAGAVTIVPPAAA